MFFTSKIPTAVVRDGSVDENSRGILLDVSVYISRGGLVNSC